MGLKSGSRDAGLDDSETDETDDQPSTADSEAVAADHREQPHSPTASTVETTTESTVEPESEPDAESTSERPTMDAIPYKLRRDKVNEGREQVPYFLREEIIDAESDLQDTLEELLDETVYKSDYREAAMIVAQRNPELIAAVLREWGYDLEKR